MPATPAAAVTAAPAAPARWDDAHDLVVASFYQHTSRDHDPQLHVHNAVLNRVECADGTWRALDSKAVYAAIQGAGAVGQRPPGRRADRTDSGCRG